MEDFFRSAVNVFVFLSEAAGATTIAIAIVIATYSGIRAILPLAPRPQVESLRLRLGSGLVLGLEFLIAADVLKTILGATLQDVAILGGIIVLRTILSISIGYELRNLERREPVSSVPPPNETPADRDF